MGAFIQELFQVGLYKRTQGRITRQVTFAALALAVLAGVWVLSRQLLSFNPWVNSAIPGLLGILGVWAAYRMVNFPIFADFLIAVEAEMNKVSWPTRPELIRASIVVLVTIFMLTIVLWGFDALWWVVFRYILKIV